VHPHRKQQQFFRFYIHRCPITTIHPELDGFYLQKKKRTVKQTQLDFNHIDLTLLLIRSIK